MEFFLVFVSCADFTPEDSLKSIPVLLIEGDVIFRFVQDGFIGVLIDIPSGSFIIALQIGSLCELFPLPFENYIVGGGVCISIAMF